MIVKSKGYGLKTKPARLSQIASKYTNFADKSFYIFIAYLMDERFFYIWAAF